MGFIVNRSLKHKHRQLMKVEVESTPEQVMEATQLKVVFLPEESNTFNMN